MKMQQLTGKILEAVGQAKKGSSERKVIYQEGSVNGKHEFLFFIKPEITMPSSPVKLEAVLDLVFTKIEDFGLAIKNTLLLTAGYLKKYDIIARHYGVINSIARDARGSLTESAKSRFEDEFKTGFASSQVYGGIEFLGAFPFLTPTSLDYLWQNSPTRKLGGGAYAQELKMDGKQVYLVNGFHPRQLEHFIAEGRSIVAFTLAGDLDWTVARNSFIGKTDPFAAEKGSLRNTLLEMKNELGLQQVNSSWNGVHLSAGPVEGLVELIRYNTDFASSEKMKPSAFTFGESLEKGFNTTAIDKILSNTTVTFREKEISIFDLTEEKNADEALQLLKEVF